MYDADIKKTYTLALRGFICGKGKNASCYAHIQGQRLSDMKELWVGRRVGLRGNMS